MGDELDRPFFGSRYLASPAGHVSGPSQSSRKVLTSPEVVHAADGVDQPVLNRARQRTDAPQPLSTGTSSAVSGPASAEALSVCKPMPVAPVGSGSGKLAGACGHSAVPFQSDSICFSCPGNHGTASKQSDRATRGLDWGTSSSAREKGDSSFCPSTVSTPSRSSGQCFRRPSDLLGADAVLFDVQDPRVNQAICKEATWHGRAPEEVSASSDVVSTDSSDEGTARSEDPNCDTLEAACKHGGPPVHMHRLRNGHYRRMYRSCHEASRSGSPSRGGREAAGKHGDSSRIDVLGWCCTVGTARGSAERIRTERGGSKKPSRRAGPPRECTKCERLEQRIRHLESRLQTVRTGNRDLVEHLRAKNTELKSELGVADRRIAMQKQTERELHDEIDKLRRNTQAIRAAIAASHPETSSGDQLLNVTQEEPIVEEEPIAPREMTDSGVQTKRVGVVMFKSIPLKEGVFTDVLMKGKTSKMALRVDYGLRLIVLNRQEIIKFILILRIAQLVTARKELTELLSEKRIRRAHRWTEDDLDNLVALRVTTASRPELILCAFPSPLLRDIFVEHTKQLRYSVEAEKGRINYKGFEGENLPGEWIVGQQSLQNTDSGRMATRQDFSGSEGESSADEVHYGSSTVHEALSWNGTSVS